MDSIKKLKELREKNNLSQMDISKMLGISNNFYCAVEKGRSALTSKFKAKVIRVFNLDSDYFFEGAVKSSVRTTFVIKKLDSEKNRWTLIELWYSEYVSAENALKHFPPGTYLIEKVFTVE